MKRSLLTPREEQVLNLIRLGYSNRDIALELGVSVATARYHVSEIISKLGVANREEAASWRYEPALLLSPLTRMREIPNWEALMKATSWAAVTGGVVILALIAVGVLLMQSRLNAPAKEGSPSEVESQDHLSIQALELDAPVEILFVSADGIMPSPSTPDVVAFYDFLLASSDLAIEPGGKNVVVAAYRGTEFHQGPFYRLDTLSPGERIKSQIDGEARIYEVVITCEVDVEEFGPVVYTTYLEAMTLITDHPTDSNKRVYVRAEGSPGALPKQCPAGSPYE